MRAAKYMDRATMRKLNADYHAGRIDVGEYIKTITTTPKKPVKQTRDASRRESIEGPMEKLA